ncbi:MAG TPA: hypothetical protein VHV77_11930, partial [Pirellulales bacterium]|nr:hypothetical protein [Pirellulales bacterium]
VAWIEPSGTTVDRVAKAFEVLMEEWSKIPSVERVEVALTDGKLIRVTWPEKTTLKNIENRTKARRANNDPDDANNHDERRNGSAESVTRNVKREHLFLLRVGNRLSRAHFSWFEDANRDNEQSGRDVDACQEVLKQFADAHVSRDGGAMAQLMQLPGISTEKPAGDLFVEAFLDPRPALKWCAEQVVDVFAADAEEDVEQNDAEQGSERKSASALESMALDDLQAVSYRATFDRNLIRAEVNLSVCAPRRGVWSVLDQSPLPPVRLKDVPADAVGFTRFSLDLARAFTPLADVFADLGEFDNEDRQYLRLLSPFLKSLGTRHTAIRFACGDAGEQAEADPADRVGLMRQAIFWPIKDDALWEVALQMAEIGECGERVSRAGFEGLQFDSDGPKGGAFVGQGWLVVGVGERVVEKMLASLPNRSAAKRNRVRNRSCQRAFELLPPEPAIYYQFDDPGAAADQPSYGLLDLALWLLAMEPDDFLNIFDIQPLSELPSAFPARDFNGMLGVTVHQATVDEHGLKVRAVTELSRP